MDEEEKSKENSGAQSILSPEDRKKFKEFMETKAPELIQQKLNELTGSLTGVEVTKDNFNDSTDESSDTELENSKDEL